MANADRVNGFTPVKHKNGMTWNGMFNTYYVPATDSTAIFRGDLVKLAGSADSTGKYPDIAQSAAADTTNLGVAIAFSTTPYICADPTNLTRNYRPASTAMYVAVVDDPDVIYEIQENGETDPFVIADIGNNCDIVVAAGNTTTGASGMEISSDAYTESTATAQLRLLRVVPRDDNALGAHCRWWVTINEHVDSSTTGA